MSSHNSKYCRKSVKTNPVKSKPLSQFFEVKKSCSTSDEQELCILGSQNIAETDVSTFLNMCYANLFCLKLFIHVFTISQRS